MKTDIDKFKQHRQNAARRGIPFEFSFDGWLKWWVSSLGENWQVLRGSGKGKYVMARIGDTDAYSAQNVKCLLFEDNAAEMKSNGSIAHGEKAGRSKLTEPDVIEIFSSTVHIADIAEQYCISVGTVIGIRTRRTWGHITQNIVRNSLRGRNQWV